MKKDSSPPPGISEEEWTALARVVLESCRKFYSDPENVKKFEQWKKERDAKRVAKA